MATSAGPRPATAAPTTGGRPQALRKASSAIAAYGARRRLSGSRKRSSLRRAAYVKHTAKDAAATAGKVARGRSRRWTRTSVKPTTAAAAMGHDASDGILARASRVSETAPARPRGYSAHVWLAGPKSIATRRRKPRGFTIAPETAR